MSERPKISGRVEEFGGSAAERCACFLLAELDGSEVAGYKSGYVTKSEYEQALRSNQKAKEAMKDNEETRSQMLAETKRH